MNETSEPVAQADPITIIMPCFNEASSVAAVLEEVSATLNEAGQPFELIAIDDGSTDGTAAILNTSEVPDKVIRHRFNRGYGASLKDGIRAATSDLVLIMDSDGQHPPENILKLLAEYDDYDMVVGARTRQASHHWRMPGKWLLKLVAEALVGTKIPDVNSGFRLMKREEALKFMHLCSDQFSFSTSSTLAFLSARLAVKFVPIDVRSRQGGKSRVKISTGFATLMLILRIIGTFNPLPIFMPPTIIFFLFGAGLAGRGLYKAGNISDAATICLICSMLLFCFGLLADQLALLRREMAHR